MVVIVVLGFYPKPLLDIINPRGQAPTRRARPDPTPGPDSPTNRCVDQPPSEPEVHALSLRSGRPVDRSAGARSERLPVAVDRVLTRSRRSSSRSVPRWSACWSRRSCPRCALARRRSASRWSACVGALVARRRARRRRTSSPRTARSHRRPDAVPAGDHRDPGHRQSCCSSPIARRSTAAPSSRRPRPRRAPRTSGPAPGGRVQTEVYPLLMFSVAGMMLFPASNDLLTMFVALEVLSLPLYLLCGLARHRRLLVQEAALKYFLLGAFSSAFFLYGAGAALRLRRLGVARRDPGAHSSPARTTTPCSSSAWRCCSVGLLFKVGAAPFHTWTPDVYQGAPTPITGFMAAPPRSPPSARCCGCSTSAFGGLELGLAAGLLGVSRSSPCWSGRSSRMTQTDIKRMLAYSSIAHAGFILIGVIALEQGRPVAASMFYLVTYGVATIGCVRHRHPGARPGRRGHAPVALGGPGQAVADVGRVLRGVPAGARRHPAHLRLHRQVRGLPGRRARRRDGAGHRRRARQRDGGVLLRAGHRDDVLRRAASRTADRRHARRGDHERARASRSRLPWSSACSRSRCWTWPTTRVPFYH